MANFAVVYDACLFYPAPLRDLMVRLAQTRRFRARWTERIQGNGPRRCCAPGLSWTGNGANGPSG